MFYQGPEDLGAQPRSHLHNRNRSPPWYTLNIPGNRVEFNPGYRAGLPRHLDPVPPTVLGGIQRLIRALEDLRRVAGA